MGLFRFKNGENFPTVSHHFPKDGKGWDLFDVFVWVLRRFFVFFREVNVNKQGLRSKFVRKHWRSLPDETISILYITCIYIYLHM